MRRAPSTCTGGTFSKAHDLSDWIADFICDEVPLTEVSMPGTHNSASFALSSRRLPSLVVAGGRCQGWPLEAQLLRGIRFLDLRVRPNGALCHGVIDCGFTLQSALEVCTSFLERHPGEVIIARIKDEACRAVSARGVGMLIRSLSGQFPLYLESQLPAVGAVRGRIVVLCDWKGSSCGVHWNGNAMRIQDQYWHASGTRKWKAVRQHLIRTKPAANLLQVNFASATALPRKFPLSLARSVNSKLASYLRASSNKKFVGIVVMDFPSAMLCELIVRKNRQILDPCRSVQGLTTACPYESNSLIQRQCELMVATTRADAAAFVHRDQEELHDCLRSVSRILLELVHERIRVELREPTVEEGPLQMTCRPALPSIFHNLRSSVASLNHSKTLNRSLVRRVGASLFGRCMKR